MTSHRVRPDLAQFGIDTALVLVLAAVAVEAVAIAVGLPPRLEQLLAQAVLGVVVIAIALVVDDLLDGRAEA